MRTLRSISTAWSRASLGDILRWRSSASATWSPTGKAGLSEVIGSWKIIESLSPRRSRRRRTGTLSRSSPSNSTSPPAMRPGGCGTRPMMERAVTLLPQPDSPTTPSVRPRSSEKSTPSTARTSPRSEAKVVRNSRTSSRLLVARNLFFDDRPVPDSPWTRLARAALEVGHEALVRLVVEPAQLGERIGVVVHAQIELRVLLGRVDEKRGRLLAALVAAGRLAGFERTDQSFGKVLPGSTIGARGLLDHALVGEHVPRNRKVLACDRARPIYASGPSVLADAPGGIDDMELAMLAPFIGRGEALDDFRRRNAGAQELQSPARVERVDERLR